MGDITVYYLEMRSPAWLIPKQRPERLEVRECAVKQFQFNRFLYRHVGGPWHWTDRLSWTDEQWKAFAESEDVRTWVAYEEGTPAGYYELQRQRQGRDVEIAYFGLVPGFIGRGYGGYLLSEAIRSAWRWGRAERVWVHTCTLDHPAALPNYKARGLRVCHVATRVSSNPESSGPGTG